MQTILHTLIIAIWVFVLIYLISRHRIFINSGLSIRDVRTAFLLKCLVGLGLWAVYTYYYPFRGKGDTFRYFDDAMVIYAELWHHPSTFFKFLFGFGLDDPQLAPVFSRMNNWTSSATYGLPNDTQTVIRLNMLLALLSGGIYWVHLLFFNFLSLFGLVGLYKFFSEQFGRNRTLWWAIVLLPSALFWGSGLLKEAPFLAAFGWYIWALSKSRQRIIVLILSALFLIVLKPYIFVAILPASLAWLLVQRYHWNAWLTSLVVHISSFILALKASIVYPSGDLLYILSRKQEDFYNTAVNAGSTVVIEPVSTSPWNFILTIPERFVYTYGRPYLWESRSMLYIPPAVENLVLVIIVICAFWTIHRHRKVVNHSVLAFIVSFSVVLAVLVGSTVPVLGAVVRYKFPAVLLLFAWSVGVILEIRNQRIKQN